MIQQFLKYSFFPLKICPRLTISQKNKKRNTKYAKCTYFVLTIHLFN